MIQTMYERIWSMHLVHDEAANAPLLYIDPFRKINLLNGLDEFGITLQFTDKIDAFEEKQKQQLPWLWKTVQV